VITPDQYPLKQGLIWVFEERLPKRPYQPQRYVWAIEINLELLTKRTVKPRPHNANVP